MISRNLFQNFCLIDSQDEILVSPDETFDLREMRPGLEVVTHF